MSRAASWHFVWILSIKFRIEHFIAFFLAISDLSCSWLALKPIFLKSCGQKLHIDYLTFLIFFAIFWPLVTSIDLETIFLEPLCSKGSLWVNFVHHWKGLKFYLYSEFLISHELASIFFEKLTSKASFWFISSFKKVDFDHFWHRSDPIYIKGPNTILDRKS